MLKTVDAREHDSALKIILAWMAVEYGFEGGEPPAEMRRDVSEGLKKLRLGIDPKTLKRVLSHAKMSLDRFQKIQEKRDGDSGL